MEIKLGYYQARRGGDQEFCLRPAGNEKTQEDFQWLKQDIESADGEATVFHAGSVEGATDKEMIASFRKARDEEFATTLGHAPQSAHRQTGLRLADQTVHRQAPTLLFHC